MIVLEAESLAEALVNRLAGWQKIVICGVGNDLRGDDGVGVYVADRLLSLSPPGNVAVLVCGELPENFVTEIASHRPSHVVLLDGVVAEATPGSILIIESDEIYSKAISTHRLPLSFFAKIVRMQSPEDVDVFVLGVRVKSCEIGAGLSPEVQCSADSLARALNTVLRESATATRAD